MWSGSCLTRPTLTCGALRCPCPPTKLEFRFLSKRTDCDVLVLFVSRNLQEQAGTNARRTASPGERTIVPRPVRDQPHHAPKVDKGRRPMASQARHHVITSPHHVMSILSFGRSFPLFISQTEPHEALCEWHGPHVRTATWPCTRAIIWLSRPRSQNLSFQRCPLLLLPLSCWSSPLPVPPKPALCPSPTPTASSASTPPHHSGRTAILVSGWLCGIFSRYRSLTLFPPQHPRAPLAFFSCAHARLCLARLPQAPMLRSLLASPQVCFSPHLPLSETSNQAPPQFQPKLPPP